MALIPLTRGHCAVVDECDLRLTAAYKWRWEECNMESGYAVTLVRRESTKGYKRLFLHNLLMSPPVGYEVDHRDGDGLNNQRGNLRFATRKDQCHNRRPVRRLGTKGIRWFAQTQKWHARISVDGRSIHLGYYTDKREALIAYNDAARLFHGDFAWLNPV